MLRRSAYYHLIAMLTRIAGYRGAEALAAVLGSVRFISNRRRNPVYIGHLSRIFPELNPAELDRILKRYWRVHQRALLGLFLSSRLTADNAPGRVSWKNRELLDEALEEGKGVILITPHFGDERTLHILLAIFGYPMHVISSKYEGAPAIVQKTRNAVSMKWHHVAFPGENPRWIYESLDRGEVVQMSPTAWAGHRGHWVMSFGVPVLAPSSAVRLAASTGCRLLTAHNHALPGLRYRISVNRFDPEGSGPAATQELFRSFDALGKDFPDQYNWMSLVIRHRETNTIARLGGIPVLEKEVESAAVAEDWDPLNVRDFQSVSSITGLL